MENKKKEEQNNSCNWKDGLSGLIELAIWLVIIAGVIVLIFMPGVRMKTFTFLDNEILSDFGIRLTPETYNKSDIVEIDDLSYIVGEHIFTDDAKKWGVDSLPNAKYLALEIEIKNIGKKGKEIPEFKLIDENEKIYDAAKKNTTHLNPEVTIIGVKVFDVTTNHNYRLIISNSKSKPKAYVNLD